MWFEKMIYTISWGFSNIEELKRMKAEEAARVGEINRSLNEGFFDVACKFIGMGDRYHLGS